MPGKHDQPPGEQPLCRRCRENIAALVVRTEPLCRDCFVRYVHTKAIKRMEMLRVRYSALDQPRKILLPVSFGVSSISLLHILDHHLKTQKTKTGHVGFSLVILFVDLSLVEGDGPNPALFAQLQHQYPGYQYASLPLQDVFRYLSHDDPLLDLAPGIRGDSITNDGKLSGLLNSLTSATARADVASSLLTRIVVEYAKSVDCEAILWGDSTTKIAEKTLSETAKGRGFSLPWATSDGESPFGINFNYPLRDVLRKELVAYVNSSDAAISTLIYEYPFQKTQPSMSSKNTTIDDLMKQYFESVEQNFPSIVSNVVRTAGKLEISTASASDPTCSLCKMPVTSARFGIHGWGGDQQDGLLLPALENSQRLCYGCTRSVPHTAV
ncbi:cytoplasmic tRNA 2-thiolation protein 2 [Dendryphion nanum]|uniref:Cytoplasmic tRNA 2-thiolation protein 2 n=1 Tax=Dendryphion nanum TaxID=256645 RepID=A0A9P9IYT8_9PLEO|nr:cytoplasmic tRNA 2-thiolation protein 2 [Dendryphion nanum]